MNIEEILQTVISPVIHGSGDKQISSIESNEICRQLSEVVQVVTKEKDAYRPRSMTKTYQPKQAAFTAWRKEKKLRDHPINDAMILLYLKENIEGKPQKRRGRKKSVDGIEEMDEKYGGFTQCTNIVYALLDLWRREYAERPNPKPYWNTKITRPISDYLDPP